MKRIFTSIALLIAVLNVHAQVVNNQFESQSACNARPLCGNTINTPYSFTTTAPFNVNPIGTCASSTGTFSYSANGNWVYYRFTCYSTGIFNFRLVPNDTATTNSNLNWALWDITTTGCGSLTTGNVVECNAASTLGATGIQTGGLPAANFEPNVTITAGSTYILGISNSSLAAGANHLGFTMNFAGTTAAILDNKKPFMASVLPFDPCSPVSAIKIKLSEPVRCSQLGVGTDFTISPAPPSFVVTPGVNCPGGVNAAPNTANNFGNTSDTANLTFSSNLAPGFYTITAVANAFFDLCGNSDSTQKTLVFFVPAPFNDTIRSGFDCVNLKYIDTICGLNGTGPYQYKAVGGGLPASAGVWTPFTSGCTSYLVSGGSPVTYSIRDTAGCQIDTTINRPSVVALGAPNLSLSVSPPCNNQFALDSITVSSVSGGTPPYTFTMAPVVSWTFIPPSTWKNIVFPGLGTSFTVTVRDANGCTRTGVKSLVNPTPLVLNLPAPINPLCAGDSSGKISGFNATGGTPLPTYTISPSYSNTTFTTSPNSFNNLPAGTYTVTATDANGCTVTSVRTVGQPGVFSINPLSPKTNPTCPANCNGTFAPLALNGAAPRKFYLYPFIGTNGPWHYSDSVISAATTGPDFDSLCPGTYTVIAVDGNGCTATTIFNLAYPASPQINIVTNNPVPCFGGTGSVLINLSTPTPPYTSANYTYSPSPIPGVTITTSGAGGVNATYAGLPAGTYTLIATNNNQCADTEVVVMTQPPSPLSIASVVVDSVLCNGTSSGKITVQATGGTVSTNSYQYSIKSGAGPFSAYTPPTLAPHQFVNLAVGVHTVRVRDHNFCTVDTIITIYQPTKLNLLLDNVVPTCFGTAAGQICVVDTGGTPDYRYKLGVSGVYTSPMGPAIPHCFTNLIAGTYSVFTIDAKGCLDTLVSTVASIALPVVSFTTSPNDSVCEGTAVTLCGTGADTYAWTGGISDCSAFVPVLGNSSYTVTGTNTTTGCSNVATANLVVNPIPVMNAVTNQTVCNNTLSSAFNFSTVTPIPGTTYSWSHNTPGCGVATSGIGNSIAPFTAINTGTAPIVVTFTVTPTGPATTNCVGAAISFTLTIDPDASITLTSAAGTNAQTLCIGDPLTDITYSVSGGGTNATVNGLPANVTGLYVAGVMTISGSPSGPAGTYTYTVTTTGTCAQTSATGTIIVSPDATLALSSAIGTDAQTVCINSPLANNITYTIGGTGDTAIVTGLPLGMIFNYSAGTLTISGSPSVAGLATYTVTASGTCTNATTTGTINVSPLQNPSFTYPSGTYCQTGTNPLPVFGAGTATGGVFSCADPLLSLNPSSGLINLALSPLNTYTIQYKTPGPCPDSTTFDVTITLAPTAGFSYVPNSYCQNGTDPSPVMSSGASTGVFSAVPAGLSIDSVTGVIDLSLSNAGTYTVTNFIPAAGGCAAATASTSVIIDSVTVLNTPANQVVCNATSTSLVTLTATLPGTSFTWSHNTPGCGLAVSGTGNIPAFTAVNISNAPVVVTFTVTPTGPGPNNCVGLSGNFTITINPTPTVLNPGNQELCEDQFTADIIFSGNNVAGTVYNWTNNNINTGIATFTGSGDILSFVAQNGGSVPQVSILTVTPTANSCSGSAQTFTVTVNPIPIVTNPGNQALCHGVSTAPVSFSSNVASSTFSWTNSDPSIGLAASGTGNIPSFVAQNTSNAPVTATICVTPSGPNPTNCVGSDVCFTITVNPIPTVVNPGNQELCEGQSTADIIFSGNNIAGTVYNWTNSNTNTGIPTFTGAGDILSFVAQNGGNVPQVSIVTVTPTANSCSGTAQTFTVTVNPIPVVTNPGNQTLCHGISTTAINFISSVAGSSFSWTNSDPSIGLAASGTGNIPSFAAQNTSNAPVTATICVTPSGPNPTNCVGSDVCFTITVNPTPDIAASLDQAFCAGDNSDPVVLVSSVSGATFTWTNSNSSIGLGPNNGAVPVLSIPSFTGTNSTNVPQTGTIIVTASANGCTGAKDTFTITVAPIPLVDPVGNQVVCDNENTTAINFTGNNVAGVVYNWSYSASSGIGLTPSTGSGNIPSFTAVNTGTTPVVATFTVTAVGPAPTSCLGNDETFTITVLPRQEPAFTYAQSTYCQTGTNPLPIFGAGTTPGGSFSYLSVGTNTLTLNPGSGLITLLSSNLGTYTVMYTTPGPCPDSATFVVTITDAPDADYSYASTNYCQDAAVNPSPVFAAGASAGLFTASPAGLNFVNPTTGQINLSTSNAGTYLVTNTIAAAGGCAADTATFTVTIDSAVVLADPADIIVCNGLFTTAFNFNFSLAGSSATWAHNTAGIGLPLTGGPGIAFPAFTAVNLGTTPIVSTFTVTPTGPNSCVGATQTFSITINPTPNVFDPNDTTLCTGATTSPITFAGNVGSTTYTWQHSNPAIAIPALPAGPNPGNVPSFTANNPGAATVSSTFTVTPSAAGCTGPSQTFVITVNPNATLALTSPAGTNAQVVCRNSPIAPIIYTMGGTANAYSVNGLPPGVSATGTNPITISGFPTVQGNYTYTVTATGSCGPATATGTINVTPLDDATFFYPNPTVCQFGTTTPTFIATPGGTFSATPAGMSINSSTGVITLSSTPIGSYTIKYVTPGNPCKDSVTLPITVSSAPCATFSYAATTYCKSAANPSPIYASGCSAGIYSSLPAGVIFTTPAGTINLNLTPPGIYQIINTISGITGCPDVADTFSVTITSKPVMVIDSFKNAGCNPTCNGIVYISTTLGTGAGTYGYTIAGGAGAVVAATGPGTATASNLCAGITYTVTVTDASGCTGTLTMSVTTTPSPNVTATSTNATAPGANNGTAQATGTGGTPPYTFSIAGPGTPLINAVTGAATNLNGDTICVTYIITIVDSKGCTDTTSVCIYDPGALLCSHTQTNVSCFDGSNGSLISRVTSGTPPYTVVSANGPSGPIPYTPAIPVDSISASGLPAGLYIITWEDSAGIQCQSVINITQPNKLEFDTLIINTPSCTTPPSCNGTLTITTNGGTNPNVYTLTPPAGSTCVITQTTPGNFTGLGVGTYTVHVTDSNLCPLDTVITIDYDIPTLSLTSSNPICANLCNGSITAVGAGGQAPLAYAISSPPASVCVPVQLTSGNFSNLGGGTYSVVVTDSKGCNTLSTINLIPPPAIVWNTVIGTNALCTNACNGSIQAPASGGIGVLSYILTPPVGATVTNATGVFVNLCAGTYTVSAQDANCSITTTVVLTDPPPLVWSIASSNNITCAGSTDGVINTTATGGTGLILYALDGVTFVGSGNFNNLLAGAYIVTAKDANGCTITTSFNIGEPPFLTVSTPVVQNVLCNGGLNGSITITANGGTPASYGYSYSITPFPSTNTTGFFGNLPAGTYAITVTDSVGCTRITSGIVIAQPAPLVYTLANHQDVACFGDGTGTITVNTQGGTPTVSYTINPNLGAQGPTGFFSGLIAGTYIVLATDANGCNTSTSITIFQGSKIVVSNISMIEPICNGDANGSVSITVSGGTGQLKLQLNGGPLQTDTVFNNLAAGNYTLTVIDALGCSITTIVTVKEPAPVGAIINLQDPNCIDSKDGKALIIGTGGRGGYKYYITPGLFINKTGIFVGLEAGSYLVRVVDTAGCEYRTNITINLPANPLTLNISKQDLACNGVGNEGTATANASGGTPPYTYLWNTSPAQTTPKATTLYYGYYNVMVVDASGCVVKDTVYIEEGPCCDVAFIPNAFSPNRDQVNDEFRVLTTAGVELIQLEIYNRWGKRVWGTIDYRRGWDGTIEGTDAPIDTYYYIFRYRCTRDNKTYTKKGDLTLIR